MSKKYTTNFLEDTNGSTGSANQVLVSTAAGIDWVDGSGSGIIGGPYLPLAGGTLTGNTNLTGSTKKLILKSGAQLGFEDAAPTGTIYLYNDGGATSKLNIGGTMWVEEAGNVGIGTTSPAEMLHIENSLGANIILNSNTGAVNNGIYMSEGASSTPTQNGAYFYYDSSANAVKLDTGTSSLSTKLTVLRDSGNVGIGTTSPSTKLHVSSSGDTILRVTSADGNAAFLDLGDASDPDGGRIVYDSGSNLALYAASLERMRITSTGNVGIGTTSPTQLLHVNSTTANPTGIGLQNSQRYYSVRSNNFSLVFTDETVGSERMRITSDGNVGIGTTSPSEKLHIAGGGSGNVRLDSGGTYYGTNVQAISSAGLKIGNDDFSGYAYFHNDGNVGIGTTSPGSKLAVAGEIRTSEGSDYTTISTSGGDTIFGNISSGANNIRIFNGGSERMRITSAGNVGIGTTSPNTALEVDGAISTTTSDYAQGTTGSRLLLETSGSGNTHSYIQAQSSGGTSSAEDLALQLYGGNVGIGTSSPSEKLAVNGNASISGGIYVGGVNSFIWNNTANSNLRFAANGSEKMRIASSGNVGIGTTSPEAKLNILSTGIDDEALVVQDNARKIKIGRDSIKVTDLSNAVANMYLQGNGSNVILPNAVSRLGIGTTNPGYKLDVRDGTITSRDSGNVNYAELDRFAGLTLKGNGAGAKYVSTPNTDALGFKTNNSERMRITSAGNVGIGTTSPAGPLEVYRSNSGGLGGYIVINNDGTAVANETALMFGDGGSTSIRAAISSTTENSPYFGDLKFKTGASAYSSLNTRMIVKGNGNVGIGTTSPGAKLDVVGPTLGNTSGNTAIAAQIQAGRQSIDFKNFRTADENDWNDATFKIQARIDSTVHQSINFVNDASYNEHIDIYTGNQVFNTRFNANGNVGIGTTSPGQKLAVQSSFANTASDSFVEINSGHEASGGSDITGEAGVLFKQAGSGNVLRSAGSIVSGREGNYSATSVADSYLAFSTAQNSVNAEKMRITSGGELIINGTTSTYGVSQGYPLHVKGTASQGYVSICRGTQNSGAEGLIVGTDSSNAYLLSRDNIPLVLGSNNLSHVFIKPSGNVGIGTTSPDSQLEVYYDSAGSTGAQIKLGSGDVGYETTITNYRRTTDSTFEIASYDDTILGYNRATNKTWLGIGTNVGIGTTSPSEKLEVSGNVKAETLIATDLTDGYVPYSKSGTLGLQDSKIYTQGAGIGVGTTTLAAGCHITSLSNISATGYRVAAMQTAPSSRGDTGTLGEIRITADYIYVCYATDSWKRVAIAQW